WDLHTLISVVAGNSLEVAQVFGLAQAVLDLVLFFARTIHSEDDFFPPIRANQLHAFHLLAMLLQDGVNLVHHFFRHSIGQQAVVHERGFQVVSSFQRTKHLQAYEEQHASENSQTIQSAAACHPEGCHHTESSRRSQACNCLLRVQNRTGSNEPYSWDNL